jgi:hypothetical protein
MASELTPKTWNPPYFVGCTVCGRDCGYLVEDRDFDGAWIFFCPDHVPVTDCDKQYQDACNDIWEGGE